MEYAKAATILKTLHDKPSLNDEEKEAVFTAIGVLAWMSLAKRKKKDDKDTEWGTVPKET